MRKWLLQSTSLLHRKIGVLGQSFHGKLASSRRRRLLNAGCGILLVSCGLRLLMRGFGRARMHEGGLECVYSGGRQNKDHDGASACQERHLHYRHVHHRLFALTKMPKDSCIGYIRQQAKRGKAPERTGTQSHRLWEHIACGPARGRLLHRTAALQAAQGCMHSAQTSGIREVSQSAQTLNMPQTARSRASTRPGLACHSQ
jgi:hypothetical protein